MAIYKQGMPSKITDVTKNDADFEKLRERVAKENNLVRCGNCAHLLAKKSENVTDIQHKRAIFTVEGATNITAVCPVCQHTSSI